MNPTVWPMFAALALVVSACSKTEPPAVVKDDTLRVTVLPYAEIRQYPEREAPATVLGKNEARIAAEVSARVMAIPVDSGDKVKKGQVLVQLDRKDAELAQARAEATVAQATARLRQAQAQMDRARSLREKNFISAEALTLRETELAAAEADVQSGRAGRDSAARGVEKCTLVAPFAGIVRSRTAQVGELAAPGTVLLSLADTSELQAVAQVQTNDAQGLTAAAPVTFRLGAVRHALKPLNISDAISRESRTVEARFRFTDTPPAPGAEGALVWSDPRPHLGADYILRRNNSYGVFVLESGKAKFHTLPDAQEGRPTVANLPADAQIVVRGRHALQDGMKVIVEPSGAAK